VPGGPLEKDTCKDYVLPLLLAAGWTTDQIVEQYAITAGRIVKAGKKHRRGEALWADYVLEYTPGVPVAIVEAKREGSSPGKGLQQAKNYNQVLAAQKSERLDVSLCYSTNGKAVVEDDRDTGIETFPAKFPTPDQAWARHRAWKGITVDLAGDGVLLPFSRDLRNSDGTVKEPRYYQRTAINRSVAAILGGQKRALLTMATGTGKTFTALQIVWKLWKSEWKQNRNPRILYLADRNILIDQPKTEFEGVFGAGENSPIWKLQGDAKPGREIYFALYQALSDSSGDQNGMFRDFSPDFFDLIIVDECHRGSARPDSSWRAILEYFSSAAQLGMTATPRRDDNVDTYTYFGKELFQYSLAEGIDDGFLAPYRVRRIVLSPDAHGFSPTQGQLDMFGAEIPEGTYTTGDFERVVSLLTRTEAAAKHLADYMARTGRYAKTVIFCVNQEHADQMRRAMHNANADIAKQHPNFAAQITSDQGDIGRAFLDKFADPDQTFPVIATTSEMLSTGVDLQTVKNIVLFRPVGSMSLFKQMIGRGTRLYPGTDKLSFDIIDYSGATALFADPEFDGPAEEEIVEAIDDEGNVVEDPEVAEPEPDSETGEADTDEADPTDVEPRKKFYVNNVQVWVTAEATYYLDPETNLLRLVEYRDFVTETVRALFPEAGFLRSTWASRLGREEVLTALERHGIDVAELVEKTGLGAADPIDVLVHLAWNQPLATRKERARRVRKEHADFFEQYQPAAREVLSQLLDKYADHGISELDDLGVLQVPPISSLGTPAEIANRFGSTVFLRQAVEQLASLVYAA
jgi:type I restriction enzyme, R subunit